MALPKTLTAGDSFSHIHTSNYSTVDGYSAVLVLRGQRKYELASTSEGTTHTFTETAANTRNWSAGTYKFVIYVTDGTDQYTEETGTIQIELRADLDIQADVRSHAQKMLEGIEALLEGRATNGIEAYSVNGRSITKMTSEQLVLLRNKYRREVQREKGKTLRTIKMSY